MHAVHRRHRACQGGWTSSSLGLSLIDESNDGVSNRVDATRVWYLRLMGKIYLRRLHEAEMQNLRRMRGGVMI